MARGAYIGVGGVARKIKKGYIGIYRDKIVNTHGLPSGYTELDYIQSSGTQYINTGFIPTLNTKAAFKISSASSQPKNYPQLFGVQETATGSNRFGVTSSWTAKTGSTSMAANDIRDTPREGSLEYNKYILDGITYTATGSFTPPNISLYLFNNHDLSKESRTDLMCSMALYYFKIYESDMLIRDFVPAKRNSDSVLGLYDLVNGVFYTNAGTGTFTAGPVSNDIPAGHFARRIRKAYIGIGGVARPCWGGGEVTYYGAAPNLTNAVYGHAKANAGEYVLISGGRGSYDTVDTYNPNLTKGLATNMSVRRTYHGGNSNSSYAIFVGGHTSYWASYLNTGEAYNAELTHSVPPALVSGGNYIGGRSLIEHAIFDNGYFGDSTGNKSQKVEAYDTTLTKTVLADIDLTDDGRGGEVGNKGLYLTTTATYVYDDLLVRSSIEQCGVTDEMVSASMGDYLLSVNLNGGIAYDNNLVRKSVSVGLSSFTGTKTSACVDGNAIFAVNRVTSPLVNVVNVYDSDLTRTIGTSLSNNRQAMRTASIGNFALFTGGYINSSSTMTNAVEAYTVM